MSFAIALPALLGVVGVAVDYVGMSRNKANLQGLADAAATAAARELALANTNKSQIEAVAKIYAEQKSGGGGGSGSKPSSSMMSMTSAASGSGSSGSGSGISVTTNVNFKTGEVEVVIKQEWKPILAHFVFEGVTPVAASATAQLVSSGKICVVGLMEKTFASVHLDNSSKLKADGCGIYSNSSSRASIRADSNSSAITQSICAVGGYWAAGGSSLVPKPTTDCPKIPDPLVDRIEPASGPCVANDLVVTSDTTLKPGTYCGGLQVTGTATAKLLPGIYVIENGPLMVHDTASLVGENVGFYLADNAPPFQFKPDSTIDLSAPKDGPMAGLLFFESRSANGLRVHRVQSNNARNLIGTIYLPNSILQVDANAPVADESAYTAIVVKRLWLKEGPTLVLNSNYAATEVPVPKALIGGQVVLSK